MSKARLPSSRHISFTGCRCCQLAAQSQSTTAAPQMAAATMQAGSRTQRSCPHSRAPGTAHFNSQCTTAAPQMAAVPGTAGLRHCWLQSAGSEQHNVTVKEQSHQPPDKEKTNCTLPSQACLTECRERRGQCVRQQKVWQCCKGCCRTQGRQDLYPERPS